MIWCTFDFDVWYLTNEDVDNYSEILEQITAEIKDLTRT